MASTAKRRAEAQLRAAPLRSTLAPPTEWASLLGELSPGDSPPQWRVHDRTHLEFAIDYPTKKGERDYVWEAYFFVPDSLRVNKHTYGKGHIYEDLHSYVRFAVAGRPLDELVEQAKSLPIAVTRPDAIALRELRIFASCVRTSISAARRHIQELLELGEETAPSAALSLASQSRQLLLRVREAIDQCQSDATLVAAQYIDEDLSVLIETTLATLSLQLREAGHQKVASRIAASAVREARYRRDREMDGVGTATVDKRDVEHLEFRRHLLKRFSASVLHLHRDVAEGGRLTLQILYAVAASLAMAFAIIMAAYHGATWRRLGDLWAWATIVMLAYAGKDRIKATLQGVFSRWVARRLPDRRWRVSEPESKQTVGTVQERSSFVKGAELPEDVLAVRNSTRAHDLERHARPEAVLWHQKRCRWDPESIGKCDDRFVAITEVFRLDLQRWLMHTDDPKQRIVFADPDDRHIYSAVAPRVYNIAIVYRLRTAKDESAPWRRIRVVVSRKGIRRVESVV
ncbi:MAG: hypothetical protein AAGE52_00185 [Myxococcota bacterium]